MSQKEINKIEKNLKLSAELHEYILKHPGVLDKLPKNVKILMDVDTKPADYTRSQRDELVHAVKKGRKWTFQPLGV